MHIYFSADLSGHFSSSRSIEQGILVALSEVDNHIHDIPVKLIALDHKGNSQRARAHLEQFIKDENALVLYTGLHSPPVLENRDFINENKILTLDPWAAAGNITRAPSDQNWIFRLSVDDRKAGTYITDFALAEGYKRPYLLLEDTGWGKSNLQSMTKALESESLSPAGTEWFNWNIGLSDAKYMLRKAYSSGADVLFFVGNAPEGITFAEAMSLLAEDQRLPIRSHWGITGGNFQDIVDANMRQTFDLKFLQTSFSFLESRNMPRVKPVLERAYTLFPDELGTPEDIKAPTGFAHAYDLTKIMLKAMDQVDPDLDVVGKKEMLRLALENVNDPVEGLIKTYIKPFSTYSVAQPDAHEALGYNDLRMAYFDEDDNIVLVRQTNR